LTIRLKISWLFVEKLLLLWLLHLSLLKKGMSNDPLHGKTLEAILTELVHHFGWEHLADIVRINCFISNPSINSSLKFLRKTPWARKKVEDLYIKTIA
jgi:uncharacterized protein (DUF2132 family)